MVIRKSMETAMRFPTISWIILRALVGLISFIIWEARTKKRILLQFHLTTDIRLIIFEKEMGKPSPSTKLCIY